MAPIVALTNLAIFAIGILSVWIALPLPPGNRLYYARTGFDTNGVGRLGARLTAVMIATGLLIPALLGVAPVNGWPMKQGASLAGLLYVPFFLMGVFTASLVVGVVRLHMLLGASIETDLQSPPTEGLARITATARAPLEAEQSDADDEHFVHDYRHDRLIRRGLAEEVENLKRAEPFVLEGPAGAIRVDTTGAHVALFGRDPPARQVADGDETTVLGTVRTDANGQFQISGADDFLYLTNETDAELRRRLRKGLYAGGLIATVLLVLAGASMNALVGFA